MKLTTSLLAALVLAACASEHSSKPLRAPPLPAAAQPPPAQPIEMPALMSQDEADAQANQSINQVNADAELEKLKKELGGG